MLMSSYIFLFSFLLIHKRKLPSRVRGRFQLIIPWLVKDAPENQPTGLLWRDSYLRTSFTTGPPPFRGTAPPPPPDHRSAGPSVRVRFRSQIRVRVYIFSHYIFEVPIRIFFTLPVRVRVRCVWEICHAVA